MKRTHSIKSDVADARQTVNNLISLILNTSFLSEGLKNEARRWQEYLKANKTPPENWFYCAKRAR
ncbi:MAG: hypothetical protein NT051_03555 [Candidatus Micrarchaeota archaeon]|nr:hypothetical protein [Candidatus Micrarchaeota archaeon]